MLFCIWDPIINVYGSEITRCRITFAALRRISRSRSSFLCFSIRSSCSKNLSCERISDDCSYHSSSCREKEVRRRFDTHFNLFMSVYDSITMKTFFLGRWDGSLRDEHKKHVYFRKRPRCFVHFLCYPCLFSFSDKLVSPLIPASISPVLCWLWSQPCLFQDALVFCWCQFLHTGTSRTAHL